MMKIKDVIFEQGFESVSPMEQERRVISINNIVDKLGDMNVDDLIEINNYYEDLKDENEELSRDNASLRSKIERVLDLEDVTDIKRALELLL